MAYSLREASEVCGKSRSTVHRALKSGKLSGSKDDSGEWSIDGAELARVFPWNSIGHGERDSTRQDRTTQNSSDALAVKVAMLEDQLERERDTVNDLRKRLDRAEDRLTALTDQRKQRTQARKGWLARVLGF